MTYRAAAKIILASASPRRKELLASAGISFSVLPGSAPEPDPEPGEPPETYALRAAEIKAAEAAAKEPDAVVIAADTVVALDGRILGKPRDRDEALEMLELLNGRTHRVVTGCRIIFGPSFGPPAVNELAVRTEVDMIQARPETLAAYADTGECMDKAGAYAIQGQAAFLIREIRGSYTNVVGLPLAEVAEVLAVRGVVTPGRG